MKNNWGQTSNISRNLHIAIIPSVKCLVEDYGNVMAGRIQCFRYFLAQKYLNLAFSRIFTQKTLVSPASITYSHQNGLFTTFGVIF